MQKPLRLTLSAAPKQRLAITPSMRQSLAILEMPQLDLIQWLKDEIEKNPLLELKMPPLKSSDQELLQIPSQLSSHDYLMGQIRELFSSDADQIIAQELLGMLDDRGFIVEPLEKISILFNQPLEQIEWLVSKLQTLDPPGIFARNLQESLLIQMKKLQEHISYKLIKNHFNDLLDGKIRKIRKAISANDQEFAEALKMISHLNFRPLSIFKQEMTPSAKADLSILKVNNIWIIKTVEDEWPKFQFCDDYLSLKGSSKEEKETLANWMQSANFIFSSLRKRQRLLVKIGSFLIAKQKAFLEQTGDLTPLTTQELAQYLDIHESTLSRALAGKYAMTPRGFLALKELFCPSPLAQAAKQALRTLIAQEDKTNPMTDEQLMEQLKAAGLHLGRRTVVKYRKQMKITTASRRKYL